jgi:ribosomal protein S18 acetylase RimI-like enzyme
MTSSPAQIRPARVSDVPALSEIVERAYGIYVERIGRRPAPMNDDYAKKVRDDHVFVADREGAVAGLLVLVAAQDHLLIENVAVDPERQGTGIGRALLAYAETHAAEHHIPELRLYTNAAMTENLTLYPRLGYREDDRRTENGLKRVYFSKLLGPS